MGRIYPINSLTTYNGNWTIKCRVLFKNKSMKQFETEKGTNYVWNVEVVDKDGTKITITCYGDEAKKYIKIFEEGEVYFISNGNYKLITGKKYNAVANDFQIILKPSSKVLKTQEDNDIPQEKYDLIKIATILNLPKRLTAQRVYVDVGGIVTKIEDIQTIKSKKTNRKLIKQTFTIVDDTYQTIDVSLWNDMIKQCDIQLHQPIVIPNATTNEYNNQLSLNCTRLPNTNCYKIHKMRQLLQWYNQLHTDTNEAKSNIVPTMFNVEQYVLSTSVLCT